MCARRADVDLLESEYGFQVAEGGAVGRSGVLGGDDGERDDVGDGRLLAGAAAFGADDLVDRVDAAAAAGAGAGAHADIGCVAGALSDGLANCAIGYAVAVADEHGFVEAPSGPVINEWGLC